MTYHVYAIDPITNDLREVGQLTVGPYLDNCWFGDERLWHPVHGFRQGRFQIGKFLLVDEIEEILANTEQARIAATR